MTENKLPHVEKAIVDADERLKDLEHLTEQLLPQEDTPPAEPAPITLSPDVLAAKKFIAEVDAKKWDGEEKYYFPNQKYYAAKRVISEDVLSRCVFELEGISYQLTAPALKIRGTRYTAEELIKDERILRYLVSINSGSVKQIS
ncbi:hypothetical protein [Neolewinella agarilytica]|uniref:Uncharacterized protein n=1 Tax=Neolewinella agarilytica TaxID=478744 RepID=A0A1H9D3J7_9BACT|nr:hypothetical protein [Neolewinella agarilytica]SEQ07929.1 hypothetical protein SAMN05444359_105129 [Neolewinella agarilytica]